MPSVQDLFSSYLNAGAPAAPAAPVTSTTPNPFLSPAQSQVVSDSASKQAEVAQVAEQKKAELAANTTSPAQAYLDAVTRHTGLGLSAVHTQQDADIINLSPQDLIQKYGVQQGMAMFQSQLLGTGAVQADQSATRTLPQAAGDFATGVGLGAVDGVGGIMALGTGLVNPAAGTAMASGVKSLNDSVQGALTSNALQAHQRLGNTENELGYQDNAAQQAEDAQTDGAAMAGQKRVIRDAATAVSNALSDGPVFSDGLAQGMGSLLTMGPEGRLIEAGAKGVADAGLKATTGMSLKSALIGGAVDAATDTPSALALLSRAATSKPGQFLAHEGSTMAAIGTSDAGLTYQQNASNVMDMSPEDLQQSSPMYRDLIAQGMTPDQAKVKVANRSGLIAAAIQGPVATLTGSIASKFEAHPFSVPSLAEAGQNILKQGVEEATQGTTRQLAQNTATQQTSNPDQDLLAGVGEQMGLGGLHGLASAGVMQAPGVAGAAATGAAKGLAGAVIKRGAAIDAANEAASPASDQNVAQAAQDLSTKLEQDAPALAAATTPEAVKAAVPSATPLDQTEVSNYSKAVGSVLRFDPQQAAGWGLPDTAFHAIKDSTNMVDAMQRMGAYIKDENNSEEDRLNTAQALQGGIEHVSNLILSRPDILNQMGPDHHFNGALTDVANLWKQLEQSPLMKQSGEAKDDLVDQVAHNQGDLTEESASTPEGQQTAQQVAAMATLAPEKVDPRVADVIMKMESAGQIQLTDRQRAALQSVGDVLRAQQGQLKQMAAEGRMQPNADGSKSSGQVAMDVALKTHDDAKLAALDHAKGVREAAEAGDTDLARQRLDDLGKFATSQQEKVSTLNDLLDSGKTGEKNAVQRFAATPGERKGFFYTNDETSKPLGITPHSANSVDLAQRISGEAGMLTDLHNHLADAYPELGAKPIEHTELHPLLSGSPAKDIADEFKSGKRVVPGTTDEAGNRTDLKQADGKTVDEWRDSVRDTVKKRTDAQLQNFVDGLGKRRNDSDFTTRDEAVRQEAQAELDRRAGKEESQPAETEKTVSQPVDSSEQKVGTTTEPETKTQAKEPVSETPGTPEEKPATEPVKESPSLSNKFDAGDLKPGTSEYEAAFKQWQEKQDAARTGKDSAQRLSENQAAVEQKNNWRQTFRSWFEQAKHGDTITDVTGQKYGVVEKTRADGKQTKTLLALDEEGKPLEDGKQATGVNMVDGETRGLGDGSIQEGTNFAHPETSSQGLGSSLGKDMQEGKAQLDKAESAKSEVMPKASEAAHKGAAEDTAKAYPDLVVPKAGNKFLSAFKLPKTRRSNLQGEASPLKKVAEALSSQDSFDAAAGKNAGKRQLNEDARRDYRQVFKGVTNIVHSLNQSVMDFLNSKNNAGQIKIDGFRSGEVALQRWRAGKLLNLVEEQPDGSFKLNQGLAESAGLAAMQWVMSSRSRNGGMDARDVSRLLGIDEDKVSKDLLGLMKSGVSRDSAYQDLASKILSYWGLSRNGKEDISYTQGIPEAMAAELIEHLKQRGLLMEESKPFDMDTGEFMAPGMDQTGRPNIKDVTVLRPAKLEEFGEGIRAFPDAIERVVNTKPELSHYLGDARPDIPPTQMNNPSVRNTAEQVHMLENESDTAYKVNMHTLGLYRELGQDFFVDAYGPGQLDEEKLNRQDLESKKGQRLSITQAFDAIGDLMTQMEAHAADNGKDLADVEVRFPHNISKVGRMQQLGAVTPQSSKAMREVLLPTGSTLNLGKARHLQAFMLGVGQGIGVKVHNMPYKDMLTKAQMLLGDPDKLAPAVDILRRHLNGEKMTSQMKADLAASLKSESPSFQQFHALTEYARYLNADKAARKAFATKLYLEADGMTNGPLMAMTLFTRGNFTGAQLRKLAMGGIYFGTDPKEGGKPSLTSTVQRVNTDGPQDMYGAVASDFAARIKQIRENLGADDPQRESLDHVLKLMNLMLGDKFVKDVDTSDPEFGRDVAKNPMTTTIYGAGEAGIASKLLGMLTEKIYEQMSAASLSGNKFDGMFNGDVASQKDFQDAMNSLTGRVWTTKDGVTTHEDQRIPDNKGKTPQDFELSQPQINALKQNIKTLFVAPLRNSIEEVVGPSLMESFDMVRQATQAQSIINAEYYRKAVDAALAKKKASGDYEAGEYLSQDELDHIQASLSHLAPIVHAPGQTFSIGSTLKSPVVEPKAGSKSKPSPVQFAAALDDTNRVNAKLDTPVNIGVKALASLNIGMGDGKMMQLISTMKQAITGTLKIFDGMNMPLDKIDQGSQQANQAVWEAAHGNPLRDVHTTFSSFLKNDPIPGIDAGSAAHAELVKALFGRGKTTKEYNLDAVRQYMGDLAGQLDTGAREVTARQQAMDEVNASIDQMAAASAPHQIQDREGLAGTPEDKATRMSQIYEEKLAKLTDEAPAKPRENISPELTAAGSSTPSGARELSMSALGKLTQQLKMKIPKAQADMINQIQKSLATAGFRVIYGTREQLLAHNRSLGDAGIDATELTNPKVSGLTRFSSGARGGEIWMVSPSSETLTHELIHAATLRTVQAYYEGQHLGANHEIIKGAIQNMEKLQAQFLSLGDQVERGTPRLQRAYANAKAAVLGRLNDTTLDTASQKAQGLNEFMAWALSNQQLVRLQQRTEASPLARLAQKAVDFLKQIVWGRKVAPDDPGHDMFSNLLFNASLVVRSQPSMQDVMHDTTMFQSSTYGHSEDLTQKDQAFDRQVTDWLKEVPSPTLEYSRRLTQAAEAVDAGAGVALHFATHFNMNLQEQTTFSKIVAAMATSARFDPNVMAEAQKIWTTVSKELTPEMLMDKQAAGTDKTSALYEREYAYGQDRLNAILGNSYGRLDTQQRSTLLPAFLALYMTHAPFRQALDGMKLPSLEKSKAHSIVDRGLEDIANSVLDSFSRRISGVGQSDDVRASMDALSKHFTDIAQNRESYVDTFLDKTGSASDGLNGKLVQVMNDTANAVVKTAEALHDRVDNRFTGALVSGTRILAALASRDQAAHVSEGLLKTLNQSDNLRPLREIARDAVGRTKTTAPIIDMISTIHAWVHKVRQEFRDVVPETIAGKFNNAPSEETWSMMHRAMGRAELSSLAQKDALDLMRNPESLKDRTAALEESVQKLDPANAKLYLRKSRELADFMMNGKTSSNLLKNSAAITSLLNERTAKPFKGDRKALDQTIDQLVTHYAYGLTDEAHRQQLSELMIHEPEGMQFVLSSLQGQMRDERSKAVESPMALFNHLKGYIPSLQDPGTHLLVADDAEHGRLIGMGYQRLADYQGSAAEHGKTGRAYYYLPVSGRAPYEQGLLQNVRQSAGGVDVVNGRSLGQTAGRILDAKKVAQATEMIRSGYEKGATEHLQPIFNGDGEVVAYERTLDPVQAARVDNDTQLHKMLGVWQGRQVEEHQASLYNEEVVGRLGDMYAADLKKDASNQSQYANLFSPAEQAKDPVLANAMKLITPQVKKLLEEQFGKGNFWVRRDLVTDVAGVRKASVGDSWTGVSRWSDETQKQVRQLAMSVFGNDAFRYLTLAEKKWQNLVSDARGNILIKSLVVPVSNMLSDTYQMIGRGVPIKSIVTGIPRKTAEVRGFVQSEVRRIEADVELRAARGRDDVVAVRKLTAEIQSIQDGQKRLSIWPLLKEGQFSSVTGGHVSHEDIPLTSGKIYSWMEGLVYKLPPQLQTAGRYALLTKDTALYQGIEKALDYSVFLSKAVYYDDLTRRQGMNHEQAMDQLAQTFTNHIRLRGRFRSYMENMGMAWFYNYKIRAAQIALSTIRQNPFHALVAGLTPAPSLFGKVGGAISDNFLTQAAEGRIGPSLGLGELIGAPIVDPLLHLF